MADDLVVREWNGANAAMVPVIYCAEHNAIVAELEAATAQHEDDECRLLESAAERDRLIAQLAAMTAERDSWKAAFWVYEQKLIERERQLAAMTAERDMWKARSGGECYDDQVIHMAGERNALKAQLTASEAALWKYGSHKEGCASMNLGHRNTACNCGFSAALAEPGKAGEPSTETAASAVCTEIMEIMATYREQEAELGYVDTPGGLEHMGDAWRLLGEWDERLRKDGT